MWQEEVLSTGSEIRYTKFELERLGGGRLASERSSRAAVAG
jgi:hypothetical protein